MPEPERRGGDEIDTHADPGFYEEAFVEAGVPRPQYRALMNALGGRDLRALERDVVADVAARGVTFGDEDDGSFTVDPVPRVLVGEEWRYLEAGLVQRVRALDAFVTDAYAEQRIVAAGVVPAHVIETASYYEPALAGARLAGARRGRGARRRARPPRALPRLRGQRAHAVGDRLRGRRPRADGPPLPLAHDGRRGVDEAFAMLGGALRAAAPAGRADPLVVVLTDGPANSAWWEHCTVAERLGLALVEVADLEVGGDGLYARLGGRARRVDVVYRRTDEDRLIGYDGRLTDVAGVLHEPWRRGQVGLVNAFGAGWPTTSSPMPTWRT